MFTVSLVRLLITLVGIVLLPFIPKRKKQSNFEVYERTTSSISFFCFLTSFIIAIIQRTLFFPAQCIFYIFFLLMHVMDRMRKNSFMYFSRAFEKKVEKLYVPLYWLLTLVFTIPFTLSIYKGVNEIASFDLVKDKEICMLEVYEYSDVNEINFLNDGKTYFVSENDFTSGFVLDISKDISYENCLNKLNESKVINQEVKIKCLSIEIYYNFDNVSQSYYSLYNWLNIFTHKRYTVYVIG